MAAKYQSKYSYFLYRGKNHDVFDDFKQYLLFHDFYSSEGQAH